MIEVVTGNEQILKAYGLEGRGCSLPAGQVGGDFFEFIACDERTVFTVIGDIMGKGFRAARLMETIRHMLRECIRINPHPLEVVRRLNRVTWRLVPSFYTFGSWQQRISAKGSRSGRPVEL